MIMKEGLAPTRREVEAKLASVGDYVKMDFLQQCLKKQLDFDTRKFVLNTLAGVYEARKMYLEAGKLMRASAEINTSYDGKANDYMKSSELLIKGGDFDDADASFAKAMGSATEMQKKILKIKRKDMIKTQAEEYLKKDKRANAMKTYEKFLEIPEVSSDEKSKAQTTLLDLYQKLGKIREFGNLQRVMN